MSYSKVPPNTEKNAERLANHVTETMSVEDLRRGVRHHLLICYEHSGVDYRNDWVKHMGEASDTIM